MSVGRADQRLLRLALRDAFGRVSAVAGLLPPLSPPLQLEHRPVPAE